MAAIVFSLLSAQPLTIFGVTGLISLFNFTIYDIISRYDVSIYPQFMAWTRIWAAIFHWIAAIFNTCDYMRYVGASPARHSEFKGVEELVNEFDQSKSAAGYLACIIAMLYFGTVYTIEKLGSSTMWSTGMRLCIRGTLTSTRVERVPATKAFYPTQDRSWLIDFWNLEVKWIFVAVPFGFLTMLLFYYDHVGHLMHLPLSTRLGKDRLLIRNNQNVSSITAQARQYPLKKPGGFHWDFFLLGCTTFVSGILSLPMPNGLVPQETELKIISTSEGEGTEIRRPVTKATDVVEQRVSQFLMGLGLIGTMTGPLLVVLHLMPAAVFAGVFFVVGWGSIESNGILQKLVYLQSEERFMQRDEPMLLIPKRKIILYIGLQLVGVAACVAVSHTLAAIGFPVLIILLIPLQILIVPRWFTLQELQILDDFTATNKTVLASLGGKPALPEGSKGEGWGIERQRSEDRHGVARQRVGSIHW
ncbi:hypothetical protein ACHAP5_007165 [Fusarium lateritium]